MGFTDPDSSDSLLRFRMGFGHRCQDDWGENSRGEERGKWIEDVDTEVGFPKAAKIAGMAETKVKWGEQGPPRTQVLAHAPGESLGYGNICEQHLSIVCRLDSI